MSNEVGTVREKGREADMWRKTVQTKRVASAGEDSEMEMCPKCLRA